MPFKVMGLMMRSGTWTESSESIHPSIHPGLHQRAWITIMYRGRGRNSQQWWKYFSVPSQVALLSVSPCDCASSMKWICLSWDDTEEILPLVPLDLPKSEKCHNYTAPYVTSYQSLCKTILPLGRINVSPLSPYTDFSVWARERLTWL